MKLLQDKVALITGASRGIGESIAKEFAAQGASVAFTYLSSEERAKKLETDLAASGVKAKAYKSDASKYNEAEKLVADIIIDFGKIDIVINNAGITKDNLLLRMSEAEWDTVMNTNLKSVYNISKQVMKPMMKQRGGSIINMSSIVGVSGNSGQSNYSASKAGIIGFTKSVAQEMGSRGIRCNAVAPGYIATEMTDALNEDVKKDFMKKIPAGRYGTSKEVADLCVFLASDMSTYINGQVINICGGLNT
jgi:3-oxoacyl-[acyl-carrier protein] reductase